MRVNLALRIEVSSAIPSAAICGHSWSFVITPVIEHAALVFLWERESMIGQFFI